MKKIMPFIVFLCLFNTVLHAQLDTFDLSQYKLPEIKFRQLDLSFKLGGNNSLYHDKFGDDPSRKYSTVATNNDLNIFYRSYRNTERLQNEQNFTIGFSPEFSNHKRDDEIIYKYSNVNTLMQFNSENRFYQHNLFFFETDFHVKASGNWSKTDDKSDITWPESTNSNDISEEIEIPLLLGHGRIEQIQDARLSVYIFEELQKAGRISKMPGNEDILEFSRLISTLKNERFFDYRLKKMEEIEKVDSFLQAKGFISSADARYFTIVNDNWEYARGPVRESGKRLSAGFVPGYSYIHKLRENSNSNPYDTSEINAKQKKVGIKLQGAYEIEKPINLHWQRSMSLKISYGYTKNQLDVHYPGYPGSNSETEQLELEAGFNYGMGYFPNSRTEITGLFALDFNQSGRKENSGMQDKLNTYGVEPLVGLDLHYYISPQFRLNFTYNISYYYTNSKYTYHTDIEYIANYKSNGLNQTFTAGFVYSFF